MEPKVETPSSSRLLLRYAQWVVLVVVAVVFVYAGAAKLAEPTNNFVAAIAAYKLLPAFLIRPMAMVFPLIEIVLAVALFVASFRRASLCVLALLCVVFLVALTQAAARGIDLAGCGCFGQKPESITGAIVKNIALLAGMSFCFWQGRGEFLVQRVWRNELLKGVGVFAVSAIAAAVLPLALAKNVGVGEKSSSWTAEFAAIRARESGADGLVTEAEALRLACEKTSGVVLVDARPDVFYAVKHLDGAINVAVDNFDDDFLRHRAVLEKATLIIVYCDGGCSAAGEVVKRLREAGLKKQIVVMEK